MIIGIAAVDRQGAIGKGGKLPWHYSADMKFFRETTTGHAVVMGRKTWLTLDKPLKNRLNIVLSRDASLEPQALIAVGQPAADPVRRSRLPVADLIAQWE